jgi:hypothetical protein
MRKIYNLSLLVLFMLCNCAYGQKQFDNWYFGSLAGLSFSTNPPTALTNGMLQTSEGCASISDANGNLLFYTDGVKIRNAVHDTMSNGQWLSGNSSSTQSGIIVKQPGNANIYFVFTLGAGGFGTLCYSTVDMLLSAGLGSVTVKNFTLATTCTEKLTAVQHCNGVDYWVLSHDWNSNTFRAFLVTASGVNTTPVLSSVGTTHTMGVAFLGVMKTSPNGRKIASAIDHSLGYVEMLDFDNATGIVSNPFVLHQLGGGNYGIEFSPDGSKLYSTKYSTKTLMQWDLCAGNDSAVYKSLTTIFTSTVSLGALQLANNGKIYVARLGQTMLGVIDNPNLAGTSCNYIDVGQSIAPKTSNYGLPNFITSGLKGTPAPFTFTTTVCQNTVAFNAPAIISSTMGVCSAAGHQLAGQTWNFGDPASGLSNTSTVTSPVHTYTGAGTYTVTLIRTFSCGNDTIRKPVTITGTAVTLSVTGRTSICSKESVTLTTSGANTYTWTKPGGVTVSGPTLAAPSLTATTIYTVNATNTITGCTGVKVYTVTVNKCTGIEEREGQAVGIYPNPGNGIINVSTDVPITLQVLDQMGLLIYEGKLEVGTETIDLSYLNSGLYYIRSTGASVQKITRFVKTD